MSTQTETRVPAINQPWPEQGGIFIGSRLIDGAVHHVVIPGGIEHDAEDVEFAGIEKAVAAAGEINGFSDWRAPDQEDLMLAYINAFLPSLGLQLNPRKTIIQPIDRGIDFVGHVIKPWRRTTRPRTLRVALQRIEQMPDEETHAAGNSYLGLVRQASHSHKERAAICRALLKRGHPVEGLHLSKAFARVAAR